MILGANSLGGHGYGLENWHFLFPAAPAGEAWVALHSPCLYAGGHSLTGQPDSMGRAIHGVGLKL